MTASRLEPLRAVLVNVLRSLELPLDDAQIDTLMAYLGLLQRWNSVYNLTAVRDPAAMLTQHLADCLAVVGPLRREVGGSPTRLLDVGSGGGLPAVVIAAAMPSVTVTSVDSVGKKAAFVRQVAGELKLKNLRAEHARVETLRDPAFDIIASRAFSTLNEFARLTLSLANPATRWLAMKGKVPTDEMAALTPPLQVFHVEQLSIPNLAAERCIVWMRHSDGRPLPYN